MTAQDAFRQMIRDTIAPALRELGFQGAAARSLEYRDGDYGASSWPQRSVHSDKGHVYFTIYLNAWHAASGAAYWTRQLISLIPGNQEPWWEITSPQSAFCFGETAQREGAHDPVRRVALSPTWRPASQEIRASCRTHVGLMLPSTISS